MHIVDYIIFINNLPVGDGLPGFAGIARDCYSRIIIKITKCGGKIDFNINIEYGYICIFNCMFNRNIY